MAFDSRHGQSWPVSSSQIATQHHRAVDLHRSNTTMHADASVLDGVRARTRYNATAAGQAESKSGVLKH